MQKNFERERSIEALKGLIELPDVAKTDNEKSDCILKFASLGLPDDLFRMITLQVLYPDLGRMVFREMLEELQAGIA